MPTKSFDRKFLESLLSQPTAPFCEHWVARTVITELKRNQVPHFVDPVGNIVLGVGGEAEYRKRLAMPSPEPVRVFLAHMDHPGFHGVSWGKKGALKVKWLGGGTPKKFLKGAKVFLADRKAWQGTGVLTKPKWGSKGQVLESAEINCDEPELMKRFPNAADIFGGFGFKKPVWAKGSILYTKAADDLIGVFTLVSLAIRLNQPGAVGAEDFVAVLTRGEEVGFVGAIGHIELGWLQKAKRQIYLVSLETSRTLPGAIVGEGPVVRLGDRATVFTPGAVQILQSVAQKLLPGKFQRRVMDGGTCEATVGVTYGIASLGISIPLGNYHNLSYEGGPESRGKMGPGPEFVSLNDLAGMMVLCDGLMEPKLGWSNPWVVRQQKFREGQAIYEGLIREFVL